MSPVHVVLAGGGTAGHIEPALNLADCLRRHDPDVGITALGTERGLETALVPDRGYDLRLITPTPMPRRPNLDLARLPARVRRSVAEVREVLEDTHADVVVGFGGYVALPAYLGARGSVPLAIHEANARPGLANRVGAQRRDTDLRVVVTQAVGEVEGGLDVPGRSPAREDDVHRGHRPRAAVLGRAGRPASARANDMSMPRATSDGTSEEPP